MAEIKVNGLSLSQVEDADLLSNLVIILPIALQLDASQLATRLIANKMFSSGPAEV